MNKNIILLILTIVLVFSIENSFAEIKTVEESCEYAMGDNDTKTDAKRLCLIDAQRKILERAGSYIESSTNVLNFNLTRDEIKAYTSGLIKTEILSDQTTFNGQSTVIRMKIKADIDTFGLESKMIEIHKDKDLSNKYRKMEGDYRNLEKQIHELQDKISKGVDYVTVEKIRLEREDTFNKLSALDKIKTDIKQKTSLAVQNVEIGMTKDEVLKLLGAPRSTAYPFAHLNYGNVWVIIENNVVTLLIDARCLAGQGTYGREQYFNTLNPCGAGKGIIKY